MSGVSQLDEGKRMPQTETTHDLRILQAARLKGRPTESGLIAAAGISESDARAVVESLIEAGSLARAGTRLKLTAHGRAQLDALLAAERTFVDQEVLTQLCDDFDEINAVFDRLVTDWQLIDGSRPNDHTDAAYDAAIMARLSEVHHWFAPLLDQLVTVAPRLAPYPDRFANALANVSAGEHKWLSLPLIDSYHTVWFELHEDLIGLADADGQRIRLDGNTGTVTFLSATSQPGESST
ncbi:hypothetical protein [Antrihabitans sp. YC2-6]|uniref:hypothetical protein n=1 Tax=Antrihabitans sp. YC2-6 TaxID=2799498 RepID=UPI0018F39A2B|nr:hypothetical protein [Antrihabitans sp. YC2-6]MBJ8345209.1 hypothetical protein [Antrihabitans sp. YC2-6]